MEPLHFTYSFNGGAYGAATSFPNLAAGTYTISVKDANGCIFNAPDAVISNTPAITAVVVTPVDASCGLSNGSVTIGAVTGGTAPYTYSFNGGAYDCSNKHSQTSPLLVLIRWSVKDANGCIFNAPDAVIGNTPAITAVISLLLSMQVAAGLSNGSVTIGAVTGGTAPYTYSFNGGAYGAATSFTNLAAGTYTISVKDANGCIFNAPDASDR